MQTLIIGDLHFVDKPRGLLQAQKEAVLNIVRKHPECETVIFLGDMMMHRNPRPQVLLALKEVFDSIEGKWVFVLRGNHDSVSKADDGVTALSLFEDPIINNSKIITHTYTDHKNKWVFIPHYEDETIIKKALADAPPGYTVFGHFGYRGVLNSAGDADFTIGLSDFKNPTILGHIHYETCEGNVSTLGTPFTTNFGEQGKDCYYGILRDEYKVVATGRYSIQGNERTLQAGEGTGLRPLEKRSSEVGPRHIVMDYDKVEDNLDWLNNNPGYVLLRININTLSEDQDSIAELMNKLTVPHVEIRYQPLIDERDEFETENREFNTAINDELFEHYINKSNSSINKEALLDGLKLIHENKQSRN